MKKFNLGTLVSVEVVDRNPYTRLTYNKRRRCFFGVKPEGFYFFTGGSYRLITTEQILSGDFIDDIANPIIPPKTGNKLLIEENVAYYPPYVRLRFADKQEFIRVFPTYDAALAYEKKIAASIKIILTESGEVTIKE